LTDGLRPLVLASRSPQRRLILERLGIPFTVVVPEVQEREQGPPEEVALQNARRKAEVVAGQRPDDIVLAVDTVVCLDGRLYGKPAGEAQARQTLAALSGRRHEVVGGLCLIEDGQALTATATTAVRFRALDDAMISWYLESEEWRDRAGAYAIQDRGAALVEWIEGDYLNVVGLPLAALLQLAPQLLP
jgi:septum formation protein